MLSHLILNKLKFWNINQSDERINANGKRYVAFPPKVVVNQDYAVNVMDNNGLGKIRWTNDSAGYISYKKGTEATCIGVYENCYVVKDLMNSGSYSRSYAIIEKDLFTPIWGGGKASLIRLYQAFKSLAGKVVAL
ncbi:hypothetical protein CYJ78_06350 [Lactobacillus crispatus]|uniref:hypothetical protein n=1 Tax=Lactobacillus crispatus TaxID=47770 RepID=UPI000C7A6354|nr:hypothetical protein [Lactobacillus crispatus]PKZ27373.1 hypothetical protein CYJ78_06350 [Lactobacillus crispatus]